MASLITAETPTYILSMSLGDESVGIVEHDDIRDFLQACAAINSAAPLQKVKIKTLAPNTWKLDIDTKSGLSWTQDFKLNPVNSKLSTKVHLPQYWEYDTVTTHRRVRDSVVSLILKHSLIEADLIYK